MVKWFCYCGIRILDGWIGFNLLFSIRFSYIMLFCLFELSLKYIFVSRFSTPYQIVLFISCRISMIFSRLTPIITCIFLVHSSYDTKLCFEKIVKLEFRVLVSKYTFCLRINHRKILQSFYFTVIVSSLFLLKF